MSVYVKKDEGNGLVSYEYCREDSMLKVEVPLVYLNVLNNIHIKYITNINPSIQIIK